MRITKVRYQMLRVTAQYENDRAEVEVELGQNDRVEDAVVEAKAACAAALRLHGTRRSAAPTFTVLMREERGRLRTPEIPF